METVRLGLETGDVCLAGHPEVAVERKTPEDFVGVMTQGRERFERELRRAAATLDRFCVMVEASMGDCLSCRRGLHVNAFLGTLATWARRYRHPIIFADSEAMAATLALRFLLGPVREAERLIATTATPTHPTP